MIILSVGASMHALEGITYMSCLAITKEIIIVTTFEKSQLPHTQWQDTLFIIKQ